MFCVTSTRTHTHPKKSSQKHLTCGIMLRFPRRSWSPIVDISTPSITILPPDPSRTLNKQFVIVDLPAPVLPTIPTLNRKFSGKDYDFLC